MQIIMKIFFTVLIHLSVSCLSQQFDHYFFDQEWPGSRCNTKRGCCYPIRGKPRADFIIEGLKPAKIYGKNPTFCANPNNNSLFDQDKILNLEDGLQEHWPSLDCPSNDGKLLWFHNWHKHGTCSIFDEYQYFTTAINLKNKLNLLKILKKKGLKPNDDYYRIDNIKNAIKNATGYTPEIHCNSLHGTRQILKVRLCVAVAGVSLVECPKTMSRSCSWQSGNRILFPSF